jgi:hypothetical protein
VVPVAVGLSGEDLAERKRAEVRAIAMLKKQTDLAWAAFYTAPASLRASRGLERAGGVRESVYAGEEAIRGAVGG